ncbi:L-aspartate oxidase [Rummeliibacillus pycnus]|uniref:L-aspartate oxidase n=1 Tax=Rummeliibacillus pycnus TaxID=101070 RepID=UPI000C9AF3F2|nr:L-aspartate oxidase [Rummeliibacillus pycnus]
MEIYTDVIILGSGVAALQSARILSQKLRVQIITKSNLRSSSTYYAQGGIAGVQSPNDSLQLHIQDTLDAGGQHNHKEHVDTLVTEGIKSLEQIIEEGFPVDRLTNGQISLGLEGAHSRHRIIHAGGDATGKHVIEHLLQQLTTNVTINEYEMAYQLLKNKAGRCIGVHTIQPNGEKNTYFAPHIIIATGGAGALYTHTSNRPNNFGDGIALAYLAGAAVTDMEFVQFHPSLLLANGQILGLVSEAVRGAGGRFVDRNRYPLMEGVHPLGDLAPRHVTAYEMYKARQSGKEVFIDISAITKFEERFPTIAALCHKAEIDLRKNLIPITPGSHFMMGGVVTDGYGRTSIEGLFAIGEAACTGVHGANRLASNSLLEGITFGKQMAQYILQEEISHIDFHSISPSTFYEELPLLQKHDLQQLMSTNVGIIRNEQKLQRAVQHFSFLQDIAKLNLDHLSMGQLELLFMHIVALLITKGALARLESRGAHIRTDYPQTDQALEKQWFIQKQGQLIKGSVWHESTKTRIHA